MLNELGLTRGEVIRYSLLPQILPRFFKLFGSGFNNLPYFIVVVFNTVRIIPNNHPFLRVENHGKYSLFQALAVAAHHIKFDLKNIDKVSIFFLILAGMVLFLLQILLFIVAMFTTKAFAYNGPGLGPRTTGAFFNNDNAKDDIAFRILDLVFGIPNIFNSSDMKTTAFHSGLHALFQFYSFGMLLIGTFIIIYLVTCVVLETAESGVPFGQRFNKAWAPIRLIVFFGLLLPTSNGINLAQYLLLNAAKMGSNVATNAWITFDKTTKTPYMSADNLIATPSTPDLESFITFMTLSKTCAVAEGAINGQTVKPYLVYGPGKANSTEIESSVPAFTDVVQKTDGGTVFIRFGVQDEEKYKTHPGAVFPTCGELSMTIVDQAQPGAAIIQEAYLEMIPCLWSEKGDICQGTFTPERAQAFTDRYRVNSPNPYPNMDQAVGDTMKTQELILANMAIKEQLKKAVEKQVSDGDWNNDVALKYGWAGAGIWFNKIAEQNGALTSAVYAKPEIRSLPFVMEYIRKEKQKEDSRTPLLELYTPILSSGKLIEFEEPSEREVAVILNQVYKYWASEDALNFYKDVPETHKMSTTGNTIIDVMNALLGTRGLFDMCKNTKVHPLAQLSSLGKGLVEHSIRSFGLAVGIGVSGGIMSMITKQDFTQTVGAATSFFTTFGAIGGILGVILFYVLPFLPFIYFFFALMTWVKGIFEAMVGMPLWALAHLRIDGEGLPGDAAQSGYYYILEIFLRPICILIGFLGSILIFGAMVKVLNEIFYLVISNLSGHYVENSSTGCFQPPGAAAGAAGGGGGGTPAPSESIFQRGVVDQFFYTVMYTIIVYMIGMSCFKLVDLIPDHIMRWLGAGIATFGAQDGDPAGDLMKHVSKGTSAAGAGVAGVTKGFGGFLSSDD